MVFCFNLGLGHTGHIFQPTEPQTQRVVHNDALGCFLLSVKTKGFLKQFPLWNKSIFLFQSNDNLYINSKQQTACYFVLVLPHDKITE